MVGANKKLDKDTKQSLGKSVAKDIINNETTSENMPKSTSNPNYNAKSRK